MSNQPSSSKPLLRKKQKGTDFMCRIKYGNTLPDVPFDTKFVPCPFVDLSRFTEYKPTRLEREFKFELHTDPALDVKIDLINAETYSVNDSDTKELHPTDQSLLEDEQQTQQNSKRSMQHNKVVPWMRKTEYIGSEFNRFGVAADRQETKVGYTIKKRAENAENLNPYKDRDQQIAAINKTFEDVKKPVKRHYEKPGVYAVEEMPLLPDFESWRIPFAQVLFDGDPLPPNVNGDTDKLQKNAIVRGMMDAGGEQFVAYFVPTNATVEQLELDEAIGRSFGEGETYAYALSREYNWSVKNKSTKGYEQENYFFVSRSGKMYYNELETRVRLNRRRKDAPQTSKNRSRLFVVYREDDEKEQAIMDERERMLINPYEDYQDDAEEEEPEHEAEPEQSLEEPHEEAEAPRGETPPNQMEQRRSHSPEESERSSEDEEEDDDDEDDDDEESS